MKQVVQDHATGRVRVENLPAPAVRPRGVLVANRASLVSVGTERNAIEFGRSSIVAKARSRPDLVEKVVAKARADGVLAAWESAQSRLEEWAPLGYSSAGVVIAVGDGCERFAVGDRVACAGAAHANHAEVVWVPQNLAVRVPSGVDFETAAFATLGAISLHGIHRATVGPGDRVVVIGLGLIGQLVVQELTAYGTPVFGVDVRDEAVALARKLGAADGHAGDHATTESRIAAFTEGIGADAVIIAAATPSSDPLALAARVARRGGRICVVGLVGMDADRRVFYDKELSLVVAKSYGPGRGDPNYELKGIDYSPEFSRWTIARNMSEFLRLAAEGKIQTEPLVAARVPIDHAAAAYDDLLAGRRPQGSLLLQYPEDAAARRSVTLLQPKRAPRAGVIGLGVMGSGAFARSTLLPALKGAGPLDRRVVIAATGTSAGFAARRFGFSAAATDPAEALEDPEVQAVIIATRHDLHAQLARAALMAGKNVFVEKPLALDEKTLFEVVEVAAKSEVRLQVGFNRRFAPLLRCFSSHFAPGGGPLLMTYRVSAGPIPVDHWIRTEQGGGRILGEVCHFIDTLQAICKAPPERVYATGGADGVAAEDHLLVALDFADGSRGTIMYGGAGPTGFSKERLEAFGQGRAAVLDNFRRVVLNGPGGARKTVRALRQDKGHAGELTAFFSSIRSGSEPAIPLAESVATTLATLAVPKSIATGKAEAVNLPRGLLP